MKRVKGIVVKLGGIALVTVALSYAFDSNWPIPLGQVRGSSEEPQRIAAPIHSMVVLPDPEAAAPAFLWRSDLPGCGWRVVLLDDNRQEIAWSEPTTETIYRPEGEFRDALTSGRGRFWYTVADALAYRADRLAPPSISSGVVAIPATAVPSAVRIGPAAAPPR